MMPPPARTPSSTRARWRRRRCGEADYLKADGTPDRDSSLNGPLAAGIPGFPAGLAYMADKYGKLPLGVSLQPAIRLADEGFHPSAALVRSIEHKADVLRRYPASSRKFLPGGKAAVDHRPLP